MTAAELIKAGYRIHEVEVTYRIPVLCKPGEVHKLNGFTAKRWCEEDGEEPEIFGNEVSTVPADWREAIPFVIGLDDDGEPLTVAEILAATKEAT